MAPYLIVWGYVGIYRRKKYVGGATGAHEGGGTPGRVGRAPYLVASCYVPWHRVQVSRVLSVEKITFLKVSFRLDSV